MRYFVAFLFGCLTVSGFQILNDYFKSDTPTMMMRDHKESVHLVIGLTPDKKEGSCSFSSSDLVVMTFWTREAYDAKLKELRLFTEK